ncbi:XdhC family protein [soil metagenome]
MRHLFEELEQWRVARTRCVLARVVALDGSGPRSVGAAMAVSEHGEVIGSVSGGCVESAVVTESLDVMSTGEPRVVAFGYSDDDAFAVGLTCGGTIHLFLEPLDWAAGAGLADPTTFATILGHVTAGRPVLLASVTEGSVPGSTLVTAGDVADCGTLGDAELDRVVRRDTLGDLQAGSSGVRHYGPQGQRGELDVTVFVESFAPPPRMFVFGAVDFAAALSSVAKLLGYDVAVCDAREVFATERRFPAADRVVVEWPHRLIRALDPSPGPRDAICVLTHDHKFDVPALVAALDTDVAYIGAMGSRRTQSEREQRLRDEGVTDEQMARIHGPIGLDLGGRTPEETAVAIVAEIIAARNGRGSYSLRQTSGPIH